MKKYGFLLVFFLFIVITNDLNTCTTAIIGKKASKKGIPMLWKNRDTGYLSNKIVFVKDFPYSYVGIVNAKEISGRSVYAGLNSKGFGIINSVAYNLPKNDKESVDLEGMIMADALRTCGSADDFERYIKNNLGATLGSWANFGVIDAEGNALIFEVHNHGYVKIDTKKSPSNYLINSNFARSGARGKGAGYLRFNMASELFGKIRKGKISTDYIFKNISRDFNNFLVRIPSINEIKLKSSEKPYWINTSDSIARYSTSAAVIIEGKQDNKSIATMWTIIGQPLTSIAVPIWVEAAEIPNILYEGNDAKICREALRIKKIIYPSVKGSRRNYMDITKLMNKDNSGYLKKILKTEKEIFKATEKFLKNRHCKEEYAKFQNKMAEKALETLKDIEK